MESLSRQIETIESVLLIRGNDTTIESVESLIRRISNIESKLASASIECIRCNGTGYCYFNYPNKKCDGCGGNGIRPVLWERNSDFDSDSPINKSPHAPILVSKDHKENMPNIHTK